MPQTATARRERARRRKNLMNAIGKDSIAIIPSAPIKMRSKDTDYKYRQDSDFFYLTGFHEPESVAVLISGRRAAEYIIFCRENDKKMETWNGRRLGVDAAPEALDADDAFPIDDIDDVCQVSSCRWTSTYMICGWLKVSLSLAFCAKLQK